MSKITLVTGLWNIKREELTEGWSRTYNHYLEKFEQLLKTENNLIIFGDAELLEFVNSKRNSETTQFVLRDLDWFKSNEYFEKIQKIRTNPDWFNQVGWLRDSTQAKLEMYNPLVMSKVFLLHDARILDKFNSDYMFWIDAGLTNTVHPGYFTHDKVIDKLHKYIKNFTFITFPYETSTEIHGFEFNQICKYANAKVDKVGRGGFFGGPKELISDINSIYYGLLFETLNAGFMGTEESLFSIMIHRNSSIIDYIEIEGNGLLSKFFEDLKNDNVIVKSQRKINEDSKIWDLTKVGLYVIGFNSPKQFQTLIDSMNQYDSDYLDKPKKFLLDNSTDLSTTDEYISICEKYGFEHIKKNNLGICGGRQFIAEHFDESGLDMMLFFEDDMFFYPKSGDVCSNGFNRFSEKLYSKSLKIVQHENLDYLKLNFTEFYGDNSIQWSWYNVPQAVREKIWPNNRRLPQQGLDPNAPRTEFKNIKSLNRIPYALGEVYYCNWPQIVTKDGNKKMFLNTKWAHPFEQTWMSYIYQETIKGEIKTGVLLMTPTEHNRFDHYSGNLRKES